MSAWTWTFWRIGWTHRGDRADGFYDGHWWHRVFLGLWWRAAPPGSETAPHSDTCVGRVHDSLGCSCGSETAPSPDAAKGARR